MTPRICGKCDWYKPYDGHGVCQIKTKVRNFDDTMCPPLLALTARRDRDENQKQFRKRVFVSSPYKADTDLQMRINQEKAANHCRFLSDLGFAPYASHLICTWWTDEFVEEERQSGIQVGSSFLSVCVANFAFLHRNRWTTGMINEREACFRLGIPVYVFKQAHETHQDGPYEVIVQDDIFIIGEKVNIKKHFDLVPALAISC
jgi:hypothetical protein